MAPFPMDVPNPDDSPPLEELLDNASWLRAVAQQMLGDGRDGFVVDDALQETWLAAMKSGPRQRSSAKAWMSTVVRNFGRQRYRGEARRKAREEDAGRGEAIPSPSEIHERLELTEQLARFVKKLPEPYRRTLVLRYYEERSPAWIAQAEGIPVRTVETRLRRGIEKMREAFEREHVGSREHWLGSLVLLAYGPKTPAPKPWLPFLSGKGMPAALLLCVALAGGAVVWRLAADRGASSMRELEPVSSLIADDGPSGNSLSSLPGGKRIAAAVAASETTTETRWHGRVIQLESGVPLGGVTLGLYTRDKPGFIPMSTGPSGDTCTEWDSSLGPTRAHISATETTRSIKIPITPPAVGETLIQELAVPRRGGGLRGVCVDASGAPLPRAQLCAWREPLSGALVLEQANRSIVCDEEGRFELHDLAGERGNPSRVVLMALTENMVSSAPFEVTVRAETEKSELRVELVPGWRVRGQVVRGAYGKVPAAGARLEFSVPSPSGLPSRPGPALEQGTRASLFLEATADEEGRFDGLLPPAALSFAVATPGFVRQDLKLEGPSDLFVRLLPGARIEGLITDLAGVPLPEIEVRLLERHRVLLASSDELGRFEFVGIELGSHVALVACGAHKFPFAQAYLESQSLPELWQPVFSLEPERRIEGTVLGAGGEPLGGVMVALHGSVQLGGELARYSRFGGLGKERVFDHFHTRTDARGRYSIGGLWAGEFELIARRFRKGRVIARRTCTAGEDSRPLRAGEGLKDCATLRGRATLADGTPVTHWRVEVFWQSDETEQEEFLVFNFEDAQGEYELPGLAPGKIRLEAFAERPRETRLTTDASSTWITPGAHRIDFSVAN